MGGACDLRTSHEVKFGLKDLLCVKDMTFRNSEGAKRSIRAIDKVFWAGEENQDANSNQFCESKSKKGKVGKPGC